MSDAKFVVSTEYGEISMHVRDERQDEEVVRQVITKSARSGDFMKLVDDGLFKDLQYSDWQKWMDAGAHIGAFAVRMAAQFGVTDIVSYEPDAENFQYLTSNLQTLPDTYTAINAALVHTHEDHVSFYLNTRKDAGMHSLHERRGRKKVTVDAVNFDDEIVRRGINCVKMDVEGAEYDILMNSEVLHMIEVLFLEYHFMYLNDLSKYQEVLQLLEDSFDVLICPLRNPKKHWATRLIAYDKEGVK